MSYLTQKTLKTNVFFSGIALHSGVEVNVCIKPAKPDFGIVFKRTDLKVIHNESLVKANFNYIKKSQLCTKISNEYGHSVSTIEHLMSALHGTGIDNAIISKIKHGHECSVFREFFPENWIFLNSLNLPLTCLCKLHLSQLKTFFYNFHNIYIDHH